MFKDFFGALATVSFLFFLCWTKSMPFFNVKIQSENQLFTVSLPYSKSEMLPSYFLNPLNETQSKMAGLIYSSELLHRFILEYVDHPPQQLHRNNILVVNRNPRGKHLS